MPIVDAVWLMADALARFSRPTISGVNAASVGLVIARPKDRTATSPMSTTGWLANASATHRPTWARPVVTSSVRLSTRSAMRPANGPATVTGTAAASRMPATARPPSPRPCRISARAVAASRSPHCETARANALI